MSGRNISGQRAISGRKPPRETFSDMQRALRASFHDFEKRHGRRVKAAGKPQWGPQAKKATKRRRWSPGAWHELFLSALERTGEIKHAAQMVGVSFGTVRNGIVRSASLRQGVETAKGAHLQRYLEQIASGKIRRAELTKPRAQAILRMMRANKKPRPCERGLRRDGIA